VTPTLPHKPLLQYRLILPTTRRIREERPIQNTAITKCDDSERDQSAAEQACRTRRVSSMSAANDVGCPTIG
jgi:hypothetical protein